MKTIWKLLFVVTLMQVFFSLAFALDVAAAIPATDDQALDLSSQLWNFLVTKNWAMAMGPALAIIVWALRKWDAQIPKIGPQIDALLNKPFVAFLLPTVVSALGGLGTALAAHQPPLDALKAVFQASMSAIFTYVGLKKLGEQQALGTAAAGSVTDKSAAIDAMKQAAADEASKKTPTP